MQSNYKIFRLLYIFFFHNVVYLTHLAPYFVLVLLSVPTLSLSHPYVESSSSITVAKRHVLIDFAVAVWNVFFREMCVLSMGQWRDHMSHATLTALVVVY